MFQFFRKVDDRSTSAARPQASRPRTSGCTVLNPVDRLDSGMCERIGALRRAEMLTSIAGLLGTMLSCSEIF